jgi:acyl-CoA synthetase (AMP-forming)/AMP-acid ligase II
MRTTAPPPRTAAAAGGCSSLPGAAYSAGRTAYTAWTQAGLMALRSRVRNSVGWRWFSSHSCRPRQLSEWPARNAELSEVYGGNSPLRRCVEHWAAVDPTRCAWQWLESDGSEGASLSYLQLHTKASSLAKSFSNYGLRPGDRVCLACTPGIEFQLLYWSCIYAGITAVPVPVPNIAGIGAGRRSSQRGDSGIAHFEAMISKCRPKAVLSNKSFFDDMHMLSPACTDSMRWAWVGIEGDLNIASTQTWVFKDEGAHQDIETGGEYICHLQFTSGSTSFPKCVAVTQDSILHNIHAFLQQLLLAPFSPMPTSASRSGKERRLLGEGGLRLSGGGDSQSHSQRDPQTASRKHSYGGSRGDCDGVDSQLPEHLVPWQLSGVMEAMNHFHEIERTDAGHAVRSVSWLPTHHDMGLVLYSILPTVFGFEAIACSPLSFVRKPGLWVGALSHYRARITAAPDFAYALAAAHHTRALNSSGSSSSAEGGGGGRGGSGGSSGSGHKVGDDAASVDLSRVDVFLSGAEPIRKQTTDAFERVFGGRGALDALPQQQSDKERGNAKFPPPSDHSMPPSQRAIDHGYCASSFMAGYGMAEATVYGSVRPGQPKFVRVTRESMGRGRGRLDVRIASTTMTCASGSVYDVSERECRA